ncbi:NlpC/P60 family protein [Streptomyces sp. ALI-76-A]|uniref:C40 family peptidase n=1 Tax=Streptomyces sp. ALI-76-A TaxID=3025736 RepID=UPI00256F5DE6|nr:NlpC/P60 family protein [Streptomyces sp. ALI-76-A]MDL5203335.1 NlpC/P60 family protein [Streptomyces sp. ALI-76-A]
MASHRKSRPAGTRVAGIRTPALATAALTSVALLSQSAEAAPADDRPSLEEVEKKVGDLYRQAGSSTDTYNAAKERSAKQRERVGTLLDDVPQGTRRLTEAREEPGSLTSAPYRTGAAGPDTATSPLAGPPRDHVDRTRSTSRPAGLRQDAVDDHAAERDATVKQRQEAAGSHRTLTTSRSDLKTAKATVQKKLADARGLLSRPAAEEKARLAATERREAARTAAELAEQQQAAAVRNARQEAANRPERSDSTQITAPGSPSTSSPLTSPSGSGATTADPSYSVRATRALAFARAQIGKPYVWGATGPGSYDCSGLTRAVWRAAGVDLPRTTRDQVNAGTTVPLSAALPGDLVFFYDDVSHVGICVGNGMMIHVPKPGSYVREESVFHDGEASVHSVVRPG